MPEDAPKATESNLAPAIDPEVLRREVADAVQQAMSTVDKDNHDTGYVAPKASENPLAAIVDPIVNPRINAAASLANAALDLSDFYASTPEAIPHKDKLKGVYYGLIKEGRALPMADVWRWFRGSDEYLNDHVKRAKEADEKKLKEAEDNAVIEGGVRPAGSQKNARDLSEEELGKALEGVSF